MKKIDFFARRPHYIDHIAPVWRALPHERRGVFTVTRDLREYVSREIRSGEGIEIFSTDGLPGSENPVLVCAYGDMLRAARSDRKIIMMEHGTGHAFGTAPYPDGPGARDDVSLFLAPNEYTKKVISGARSTRCEVIGTPKMDEWIADLKIESPVNPVIAIAFHWGNRFASPPESGTAWAHYREILPELAKRYHVIGHGHPLSADFYKKEFEQAGIPWMDDFRKVMKYADIYINDLSSTLYEFLVTRKPVIVLNAPWFRREIKFGLRFWDYSDVGINVNEPSELWQAIDTTLESYEFIHIRQRFEAVTDLYPHLGESSRRAAAVIVDYLEGL